MKIKSQLPNTITLLNLAFGVIGIIRVLDGNILEGAIFILIAAILDFLDGFLARILKVQSPLGKELDSLADVVSFGVLPGVILFQLAQSSTEQIWLPYLTLIVPMLSAYRLAKFNLDTRQQDRFIGLPTPANALFISTLPYFAASWPLVSLWMESVWFNVGTAWIMSILLISELPLIALKFKDFSFKKNKFRFLLIGISLPILIWFQLGGIPLVILSYIGLSILENSLGST